MMSLLVKPIAKAYFSVKGAVLNSLNLMNAAQGHRGLMWRGFVRFGLDVPS